VDLERMNTRLEIDFTGQLSSSLILMMPSVLLTPVRSYTLKPSMKRKAASSAFTTKR